jgi:hypothetical protein
MGQRANVYGPRRFDNISLTLLADGQLYGVNSIPSFNETELTRYGTDGQVQWSTADRPLRNWCPGIAATPASALWLLCEFSADRYQLLRSDSVGRIRAILGPDLLNEGALRASLATGTDGAAYVAGSDADGVETLWRFAADATLQWQRPIAGEGGAIDVLATGANDQVAVLRPSADQTRMELYVHAAADGAILLEEAIDLGLPVLGARDMRAARDNGWIVTLGQSGNDVIARLSPSGQLQWILPLPEGRRLTLFEPDGPALLEAAGGQIRLVAYRVDTQSNQLIYEYFAIDTGAVQTQIDIAPPGEVLDVIPRPLLGDFLTTGRHGRIDQDGVLQDIDLSATMSGLEQPLLLAAYSEGEQRIVVQEQRDARLLQSWQRDGQLRWQQALPRITFQSAPLLVDLQVNAGSVCTQITETGPAPGLPLPVICFDRDSGVEQLRFEPSPEVVGTPQHRLLAGAELARVVRMAETAELTFTSLLDGSSSRPTVALNSRLALPTSQPGAVGIAVNDNGRTRVFWTDDQTPATLEIPRSASEQVLLQPQGLLLDSDWYARAGGPPVPLAEDAFFGMQMAAGEQTLVVMQPQGGRVKLWGLDSVSGMVLWNTTLRIGSTNEQIHTTPDPAQVLVTGSSASDLDLRWVSRADGSVSNSRSLPCGANECNFELGGQISSPQGLDLLELRLQADTAGALRAVHLAQTPALIPVDQVGIGGLWYQPVLAGQGLVLTYVPESRTLFAPWFNYQSFPRMHDQSTLRWYSVQGVVAAETTVAELRFLRNAGGRFAEPPVTQAEDIGTARLRFENCDHATLEYDLGLTAEGAGSLPLLRLGPRTQPCLLADGSIQPAALQAPDSGGFSARQSGAWFDPVTSGQGLMVEVVPASASQNGLLFAAWFSYDLAEQADDAFAQDWFILQGDLATAVDGQVTVPILRAIGGNFDRSQTSNIFHVGEAQLQFNDCNSLQLSYRFDDSELAQAHAGLQGQQLLERIGGCVGTTTTP